MIIRYYSRLYEYACGLATAVAYSSTFSIVQKIDINFLRVWTTLI